MDRVFISSTVYDLIDARAEIESFVRDLGLSPVLSGSSTADFELLPDRNSIETCLANLRSCQSVIVLLSQRYGPKLGSVGYDDVSATHLEYNEARKQKIPVYVYVRDRLEAEYAVWKKNRKSKKLKLKWIPSDSDRDILFLLDAHRRLEARKKSSNWFDIFQSTQDLKRLIIRDFGPSARRKELETLVSEERIPVLDVSIETTQEQYTRNVGYAIQFKNVGTMTAYNLRICLNRELSPQIQLLDPIEFEVPNLAPGQSITQTIAMNAETSWEGELQVEYVFPQGHRAIEEYRVGGRLMTAGMLASGASLKFRRFIVGEYGSRPFSILDRED